MTDTRTLFHYRLRQAEETLSDAEKMLEQNLSPRSIINRAYYSMFYALLALYIANEMILKTSKHSGVIALFDKEFIHNGKIEPYFSKFLINCLLPGRRVITRNLFLFQKRRLPIT